MTIKIGMRERVAIETLMVEVAEELRDSLVRWYVSEHREEYNAWVRERAKPVVRKHAVGGMHKIAGEHAEFGDEAEKAWDEASEALFITEDQARDIINHFENLGKEEVPKQEERK